MIADSRRGSDASDAVLARDPAPYDPDMLTDDDRAVASALIGLDGIAALSLGGSRAVGVDDAGSDTDLYAWFRGPLVGAGTRRRMLGPLADGAVESFDVFGPEDHFAVRGRPVEVVYLDLATIDEQVERAGLDGLAAEVCATAFLHTAYVGIPVVDPHGELARLRVALATYPEATRERQFTELPQLAAEFAAQLVKAQSRGDWPMVLRRRAGLVDVVASLVLALNRRYHPGEKRLLFHLAQCDRRPEALSGRLRQACLSRAEDPGLAPGLLDLVWETAALREGVGQPGKPVAGGAAPSPCVG